MVILLNRKIWFQMIFIISFLHQKPKNLDLWIRRLLLLRKLWLAKQFKLWTETCCRRTGLSERTVITIPMSENSELWRRIVEARGFLMDSPNNRLMTISISNNKIAIKFLKATKSIPRISSLTKRQEMQKDWIFRPTPKRMNLVLNHRTISLTEQWNSFLNSLTAF